MKTTNQILKEIHEHRPMSRAHLYTNLRRLGIEPVGARQRPQRYPSDTAARILSHLGFEKTTRRADCPTGRVMSMTQLRAEKSKSARRAA